MNEERWIQLLHECMPPLYRAVSRRVGGQRDLAEDITQEAWLRALEHWRREGVPKDPPAWLHSVASNLLRNHFRKRKPETGLELDAQPDENSEPSARAANERRIERVGAVQVGLARLKPAVAELLAARHLDGSSIEELAAERRVSVRALEGRLRRGRQALARHIDPAMLDETEVHPG